MLISGSRDTTVKVWNLKNFTCDQTLTGHAGACPATASAPRVFGWSGVMSRVFRMKRGKPKPSQTKNGFASSKLIPKGESDLQILF